MGVLLAFVGLLSERNDFCVAVSIVKTRQPHCLRQRRQRALQAHQNTNTNDNTEVVTVRYGYFTETRPLHAACARGWLDLNMPSLNRYYRVECYPQPSGTFAASRLDNADLEIAHLGSTPLAQGTFYCAREQGCLRVLYSSIKCLQTVSFSCSHYD